MKDFEELTEEQQNEVILNISSKLDKQEIWYWEGLVHKLREQENIIKEVRELNYKIQEDYSHQALFNNDFASGMYKASEMNIEILDKENK